MQLRSPPKAQIYADPKYRCLCDTHVEKGAYIIAIVGVVLSAMGAVAALIASSWYTAGLQLVWTLLYTSILYAQKKRDPVLYLPYLVLTAIGLVLLVLLCVFLVVAMIAGPDLLVDFIGNIDSQLVNYRNDIATQMAGHNNVTDPFSINATYRFPYNATDQFSNEPIDISLNSTQWTSAIQKPPRFALRIALGVILFVFVIILSVKAFFYSVIYRAWGYMRDEQRLSATATTTSSSYHFTATTPTAVTGVQPTAANGVQQHHQYVPPAVPNMQLNVHHLQPIAHSPNNFVQPPSPHSPASPSNPPAQPYNLYNNNFRHDQGYPPANLEPQYIISEKPPPPDYRG